MNSMQPKKSNIRKIEIDKYGKFIVYGHNPWALIPTVPDKFIPAGWIITDAPTDNLGVAQRPHFYNSLIKITPQGAQIPVVFTGPKGYVMAEEIVSILNKKL